jgi:hypothetical protein
MFIVFKFTNSYCFDNVEIRCVSAKEMMARRQKLIKLADSAELGWRVVQ